MKKTHELSKNVFKLDGKVPLKQAIPLGLQHVMAMFVGNLTPLLIITGSCGIAGGEFADLQLHLLQNAMLVAGLVTLVQLFSIGPVGGNVPIIMGTSSGFIGVFNSVAATMGGGVLAYGAIMGASIIGGLFGAGRDAGDGFGGRSSGQKRGTDGCCHRDGAFRGESP